MWRRRLLRVVQSAAACTENYAAQQRYLRRLALSVRPINERQRWQDAVCCSPQDCTGRSLCLAEVRYSHPLEMPILASRLGGMTYLLHMRQPTPRQEAISSKERAQRGSVKNRREILRLFRVVQFAAACTDNYAAQRRYLRRLAPSVRPTPQPPKINTILPRRRTASDTSECSSRHSAEPCGHNLPTAHILSFIFCIL